MGSPILILGTGQCGFAPVMRFLHAHADCRLAWKVTPTLGWQEDCVEERLKARLGRVRRECQAERWGDVSPAYLPYVSEILRLDPGCRILCLQRPRDEVAGKYAAYLDKNFPGRMNHWSDPLPPGETRDPVLSRGFPRFAGLDRDAAINSFWGDYNGTARMLAGRFPGQFRIVDPEQLLTNPDVTAEIRNFLGLPEASFAGPMPAWRYELDPDVPRQRPAVRYAADDPDDPARCAVLVPFQGQIVPHCEESLRELEKRGYPVQRVHGYAAVDQARNQMATDALIDGYDETMWIDSDIGFEPDAVDVLRRHRLPITCGIYPQKGRQVLASHVLPGTELVNFGTGGGLHEFLYAGTGFLHVRREVYLAVQAGEALPVCNERFEHPMIPFFQPLVRTSGEGEWYLAEDFAFCERARRHGFRMMADTSLRLWHYGNYGYSWEDAGRKMDRVGSFRLNLN